MASGVRRRVVILYEHALLGEGIARYLSTHAGVEATVASARDRESVLSALASDPAVVIFEMHEQLQPGDLAALAPHAVLIDVSTAVALGPIATPCASGLEQIVMAVRSLDNAIGATAPATDASAVTTSAIPTSATALPGPCTA